MNIIVQLQSGDKSAFNLLQEQYAGLLIASVSQSIADLPGAEFEDLMQEATLALYRAAMRYDVSQTDVTFGLFAKICIRNRLVSIARRYNKQKYIARSLKEIPLTSTQKKVARRAVFRDFEDSASELLSKFELSVYELYLDGCSIEEIAEKLGKSSKSIDNAIYRMKRKIKLRFQSFSTENDS